MSKYKVLSCNLVCPNNTHDPIPLPHGQSVQIGRSPQTRIMDPRSSRNQVEVIADWKKESVKVTQIGNNSSALDGIELEKGRQCKLEEGATIYVLAGQYPQKVEFVKEKIPNSNIHSEKSNSTMHSKKRPASDNGHNNNNSKKARLSNAVAVKPESSSEEEEQVKAVEEKLKMMKKSPKKHQEKKTSNSKHSTLNTNQTPSTSKSFSPGSSKCDEKSVKKGVNALGPPKEESKWEYHDKLYVYTGKGVRASSKIAGFDIDGTIITTKSGRVFPKDNADWKILYPEVPGKLKKLHEQGYKVVLFTNQKGVEKGKTLIEDLQQKFTAMLKLMGVSAQILISTGDGVYRKPCLGMLKFLRDRGNEDVPVSITDSFYVGDAAGRPAKWAPGKKKDFSCSDRMFAMNAGLKFYTPEEYFQGQAKAKYEMPDFDPRKVTSGDCLTDPADAKVVSPSQEMVILVGFPASGKSFFSTSHLLPKGYIHINRDTLGTWQKCVSVCTKSLNEGKSVVIDNTNTVKEQRQRYIPLAKKAGIPCRCFVFTASLYQCRHNEKYREMVDKKHKTISDVTMNTMRSKYEEPENGEGFSEIVKINFVPNFENPRHERWYKMFLVEK
ncbi:bifunctional polynucleotide phosphatase/kinase-like [Mizuhopecten yessoensis]|uniref:Bifunctional polynucleotide phosphatase/kinase n=1 Tax=Mizuhopecten yessoensis TaxID=6573 RepID=A0A210PXZ4_MIZYE|nr:bifunctional polynucleotide phosphatase/kinase-like [Mizuhopecten yessoensis]OWF41319.1 Bifunctional polynucleotide phosphatase/kinase [Mizuhopecten yessoensis]